MGEVDTFTVVFNLKNSIRNLQSSFCFRVGIESELIRFDSIRFGSDSNCSHTSQFHQRWSYPYARSARSAARLGWQFCRIHFHVWDSESAGRCSGERLHTCCKGAAGRGGAGWAWRGDMVGGPLDCLERGWVPPVHSLVVTPYVYTDIRKKN